MLRHTSTDTIESYFSRAESDLSENNSAKALKNILLALWLAESSGHLYLFKVMHAPFVGRLLQDAEQATTVQLELTSILSMLQALIEQIDDNKFNFYPKLKKYNQQENLLFIQEKHIFNTIETKNSYIDYSYKESKNFTPYDKSYEKIFNKVEFEREIPAGLTHQSTDPDIIAIKRFLRNPLAVARQLAKLERALEKQAGERFDKEKVQLRDYEFGKVLHHKKLLSGYLQQWALKNGFNPFAKLVKAISVEQFSALLISKSLFKDTAFRGTGHGEWTHAIQWFCLTEQHNDEPFLSISPAELYAKIGTMELTRPEEMNWFNTFEFNRSQVDNIEEIKSNVFHFNDFLMSNDCLQNFPVLCQLIRGREAKGIYVAERKASFDM